MPEVFADTGYWIPLLNERDSLHRQARELSARFSDATIVTTEMVLTELLNNASRKGNPRPGRVPDEQPARLPGHASVNEGRELQTTRQARA